jgi:hypothetical protein
MIISISQKNLNRLYALQQLAILLTMILAAFAVFVYEVAIEPKLMDLAVQVRKVLEDPEPVIDWLVSAWWDVQEVSSLLWDGVIEFAVCFAIGVEVLAKGAHWVLINSVMPEIA